jgi:hypothetical protein
MKLKKPLSLFLAFFILVSNVGFAFNIHYCGKSIASITLKTSFSPSTSEKNCCGAAEKKAPCCKNKTVHFQKKIDQAIVKSFAFQANEFYVLKLWQPLVFTSNAPIECKKIAAYCCDANAPPLFKLHHQFIFYDQI